MKKNTLLLFLLLFVTAVSFAQTNVGLFEQCNYSGKSSYLTPGSYRLYQMGIGNDKLSSLQIPNGMRVTIYEDDNFKGKSATYTSNTACIAEGLNDNASSIVVESLYNYNNYNQNDYITFYNDCSYKGLSRSLRPGTYSGSQLGDLKLNISSLYIYGNLQVKIYTSSDNAVGYGTTIDASTSCLSKSYNDKIRSLVIEYKSSPSIITNPGYGNNSSYATVYADCNYGGSSLRLAPGYYQGDKLGLMKYNISSIEIPSNLKAKVYINNENLSGSYYTIGENTSCLSSNLNNRIGSLVIEERNGNGYNNNNNQQYQNHQNDERVILYTDSNFKGTSSSVLPGTYSTMALAGFTDNSLSSLYLPQGYRVVLYEFENFGGKTYTITETRSGFTFTGWNDKTSSIAIYRN